MCPWEAEGLKCGGFSLTESLPEEKSFLGLAGPCCCCRAWELPLLVAQLYLTEASLNSYLQIKPQESLRLEMILSLQRKSFFMLC